MQEKKNPYSNRGVEETKSSNNDELKQDLEKLIKNKEINKKELEKIEEELRIMTEKEPRQTIRALIIEQIIKHITHNIQWIMKP